MGGGGVCVVLFLLRNPRSALRRDSVLRSFQQATGGDSLWIFTMGFYHGGLFFFLFLQGKEKSPCIPGHFRE